MAIRENVNVFTENVRTVSLIDSPVFGQVAYIAVGAMMVKRNEWCNEGWIDSLNETTR
jgi:phosphatidylserine decarboxylase